VRIRSGPLIQMDETRMQVHRESGRPGHNQSYMWIYRVEKERLFAISNG
jgi:hypothetical protein